MKIMRRGIPTYSDTERQRRWRIAHTLMDEQRVDALIVYGDREGSFPSPFAPDTYFTNDRPGAIVIFPREGEPISIVAFPMAVTDQMQARLRGESVWIHPENVYAGKKGETIVQLLQKIGLTRGSIGVIGLEPYPPYYFDGAMPYNTWKTVLTSFPGLYFKPVQIPFIHHTSARSTEELEVLSWSAEVGEKMCEAMRDATRVGASEADIYAAAMDTCPKNDCFSGMMLLGSGHEYFTWGLPTWTYRPHVPRVIQDGDVVLAEVFCSLGMLETQHQPSIAVGNVHPDFERAAGVARESYNIGLHLLRAGNRFGDVVNAMEEPVRTSGGWHVRPWIHGMNPFGLISGMQDLTGVVPGAERYGRVGQIPLVGADVELRPGMTFAMEPNCAFGKHAVNIGGTVIVGETGPVELNHVTTSLMHV